MKYEWDVLTALIQLSHPNIEMIAMATGISSRKVQSVVHMLTDKLGMEIDKVGTRQDYYFVVRSWGIFESGSILKSKLVHSDLVKIKAARLAGKKNRSHQLDSLAEKQAYFDQVKVHNYKQSMRLEGVCADDLTVPQSPSQLAARKAELLALYVEKAGEQVAYVG
jgi:hypothetical protein